MLGVIKDPNGKSCANYFPGSFAEKHHGGVIDEELIPSVALGPTLNILANQKSHQLKPEDNLLNIREDVLIQQMRMKT